MDCCESESDFDYMECAKVGKKIKNFVMEAFDPAAGGFTSVDFEKIRNAGKWLVLMFYPADFSFVCPTELADLATKHAELERFGAEVVSVSTDTRFVHLAWKKSERLLSDVRFLMAGDPSGEVSRYFDVWDPATGLDMRGTFLVDPEGLLVASEINLAEVGRNVDELVRKFEANVYLRRNPGEVCPAKWTPGAKTLVPSEGLVGKVAEALDGK